MTATVRPTVQSAPKSLDELPINVIFKILSELQFTDLKNVSETCWTLRILTNEKLMYHSVLHDSKHQYLWTQRYFLDSLRILQRQKPSFDFSSLKDTTIIQSLRYLHHGVRKVSDNLLKMLDVNDTDIDISNVDTSERIRNGTDDNETRKEDQDEGSACQEKPKKYISTDFESDMPDNSDLWESLDSIEYQSSDGYVAGHILPDNISDFEEVSEKLSLRNNENSSGELFSDQYLDTRSTPSRISSPKHVKIDEDGLRYLQVLDKFHKVGTPLSKKITDSAHLTCNDAVTPTKYNLLVDDVQFTPLSTISSLLKRIDSCSEPNNVNSPESYGIMHSRSGSSVFSDTAPRLSENTRSNIYVLDHQSVSSSDSESSSSTEFIRQLRSSTKVKDKAVLFERLLSRNKDKAVHLKRYENKLRDNRKASHDSVQLKSATSNSSMSDNRLVSDKRLHSVTKPCEIYESEDMNAKDDDTISRAKSAKRGKTHRRRKLKALILNGNRICYEKI